MSPEEFADHSRKLDPDGLIILSHSLGKLIEWKPQPVPLSNRHPSTFPLAEGRAGKVRSLTAKPETVKQTASTVEKPSTVPDSPKQTEGLTQAELATRLKNPKTRKDIAASNIYR